MLFSGSFSLWISDLLDKMGLHSKTGYAKIYEHLLWIRRRFKAEGEKTNMKKGIHPNYQKTTVTCTTCGSTFETGSVKKDIRVDTCSNCHPFFTGRQRFAAAQGRIEKFNQKYGLKK